MGFLVKNGGFLTTIQDAGRTGYQQFGVPVSGVMDPRSAAIANILVGNDEAEAVLEITLMGPMLEVTADNIIAITGANLSPTCNGAPLPLYRAVPVKAGDKIAFGMQKSGCRAFLAVAGGFDIAPVMGSRSTYLKAKIGGVEGRKLQKDDKLGFRAPIATLPNLEAGRTAPVEDFSNSAKTLRVIIGPQDDAFTEEGIATFLGETYTVTQQFDRMGCRLDGATVAHKVDGNIISDGISMGAIQIPSEGKPIIMLADRQTTGGYTKIANVISVDFPIITQCKAGDTIRFEKIDITAAQKLYLDQRNRLAALRKELDTPKAAPAAPAQKLGAPTSYKVMVGGIEYTATICEVLE